MNMVPYIRMMMETSCFGQTSLIIRPLLLTTIIKYEMF